MKKRIISIILAAIAIVSMIPCSVGAAAADEVAPCWDNTSALSCKISFPGDGYGYAEGFVMGYFSVSKITADVYVYRQVGSSWVYVAEEHTTVNSSSLGISCKFTPVSGAYYKAVFTFVVTMNGVDETITDTAYKTA